MKSFAQIKSYLDEIGQIIEYKDDDLEIKHISYDSRDILKNTLFFCKGANYKEEYLFSALDKGAVAYISEKKYTDQVPYIIVKDIRLTMMELARFFYDYPDKEISIVAVTGTKGKSSTVSYIKSILDSHLEAIGEKPAGILSSILTYDGVLSLESKLTTPEALLLFKHIRNAVDSGLKYMVVEASSQAFKYNRINNLEIDYGIFLNIGHDHVSPTEHPSFDDYFSSKLKIFDQSKTCIYNSSIDFKDKVESYLGEKLSKSITFSTNDKTADFYLVNQKLENKHLIFETNEKEIYSLNQIGSYNIENALAAISYAKQIGISYESIKEGLINASIEGRENIFISDDENVVAFVSYAHNGLSFRKCFEFINEHYPDYKVISMFGAGGERALVRMQEMCEEGGKNSDFVYIIPDDPGYKPFAEIADKMEEIVRLQGCEVTSNPVREDAIRDSFSKIDGKTLLFIAGKGGETYNYAYGIYEPIKDDLSIAKEEIDKYNKI